MILTINTCSKDGLGGIRPIFVQKNCKISLIYKQYSFIHFIFHTSLQYQQAKQYLCKVGSIILLLGEECFNTIGNVALYTLALIRDNILKYLLLGTVLPDSFTYRIRLEIQLLKLSHHQNQITYTVLPKVLNGNYSHVFRQLVINLPDKVQ